MLGRSTPALSSDEGPLRPRHRGPSKETGSHRDACSMIRHWPSEAALSVHPKVVCRLHIWMPRNDPERPKHYGIV
jgi:hypothetical protein